MVENRFRINVDFYRGNAIATTTTTKEAKLTAKGCGKRRATKWDSRVQKIGLIVI